MMRPRYRSQSLEAVVTGVEVRLDLPGADGPVIARAVRSDQGLLALAFRQDEAMLRRVDRALEHIAASAMPAAA